MDHTNCPRCGLVNWSTPEVCERCGLRLGLGSDVTAGPASQKPPEPPVWKWYIAYCAAMAAIYLLVVIMGIFFLAIAAGSEMNPREAQEAQVLSLLYIGLGMLFLAPYAVAPFLPRRRWAWVVGVVLIGAGMTSMCCLPAAIPLLIFWLKPENKAFFGGGGEDRLTAKDNTYTAKEDAVDLGMLLKMFAAGGLYVLAITLVPIFLISGWLIFGFYGVAFVLVVSLVLIVWRVFRDKSSDTPGLNLHPRD